MTYKWLLPVCSALLFVSCQKEAADNNTFAHLFSLKKIVEAEEGDPLVVALKLDRVLDNDLQLAVELSDQVRFPMNKNDIATDFDFSYDGGKRWYRSLSPKRLIIPSGQDEVLLRYETYDDLDPELWSEQRKLRLIKSHESSGITLLSDSLEIQLSIADNESVFRSGPGSMRLQRSGAGFKIVSLSSAKITPAFKPIVDGGYLRLVGRTGVPINTFFGHHQQAKNLVFYEKTNWVGALRSAPEHQSKNWTIAINPLHENMIDKSSLLLYNDAKMAYVSTHLAAHMLCLSEASTAELHPQDNPKKWVAEFYKTFYDPDSKRPVVEPEFVSVFAQKGFYEDLAETLAFYVVYRSQLSALPQGSSTALQKLHYVSLNANVQAFAQHFAKLRPSTTTTPADLTSSSSTYPNQFVSPIGGANNTYIDCFDAGNQLLVE